MNTGRTARPSLGDPGVREHVADRVTRWAESRAALAFVIALGALTYLPAVRSPFLLDDYMHAAMVRGTFIAQRGPLDLYDFVNEHDRARLNERGMLPWWSHPKLMLRFFRPLSSALRWEEQRAIGDRPVLMHVHSLAWWAAVVIGIRRLYRRAFSARVTWLATAMYALGPWNVLPIAWLANREALVTLAFGTFGLAAYARWRDERRWRDAATATGLFALAALAGEYAVCLGGYVAAIEIVRRRERIAPRAVGLAPFVVPIAAYLGVRAALGYGAYGSAFYADPLREPGMFLAKAPGRLAALLTEGWLTLGTQAWGATTPKWGLALIAVAAAALLVVPIRRAFGALDAQERATATWLLVGSLLSLVPMLSVVPAPRLLGVSAVGMTAVIAVVLDHAWFPAAPWPRRGSAELTALVATFLGFAQLVHGPLASWIAGQELRTTASAFERSVADVRARLPDVPSADVNVVRGTGGMFFGAFALDPGNVMPARWRGLAHAGHVLVLRKDARTLELLVPDTSSLYPIGPGNLFRSENFLARAGDVIQTPGMRVTVLDVGPLGPRRARFEFDHDIEQTPMTWLEEGFTGFRPAEIPGVGFGAPFDP